MIRYVIALILVTLLSTVILGQDKKEVEERQKEYKNKMLAQLESPHADERREAGMELQGLVTERDIKELFKERPIALVELLSGGWPKAADCVLNALYEYTEETRFVILFADALLRNKKLGRMHEELAVSKYVREYWYADWRNRRPKGLVWAPVYQYVASNKWLVDLWYQDNSIFVVDKVVVSVLSGIEFVPNPEDKWEKLQTTTVNEFGWIKALRDCKRENKNLLLDMEPRAESYSVFDGEDNYSALSIGWLTYAEYICLLLDKPEWAFQLQDKLKDIDYKVLEFNIDEGKWQSNWHKKDATNIIFNTLLKGVNGKLQECIDILTIYFNGGIKEWSDTRWDYRFLYNHPWLERLRLSPKFCEFWKSWDLIADLDNPDPIGLEKNWTR